MGFGDFEADDSEFRYEGSLPVLAGRFRRKVIGYFNGNIPPGMRTGREVRLVKLPQLTWVYGYLMRAKEIGPVLYIKDGSLMDGVEGFHPLRSASAIRQANSDDTENFTHTLHNGVDLDDDFDALTDIAIPHELEKTLLDK
jgi:hypothetical protein